MKRLAFALLTTFAIASAAAGSVKSGVGKLFDEPQFKLVSKTLQRGETINKHDHKGYRVVLAVTQGDVEVVLNDNETHALKKGDVLLFEGQDLIETRPAKGEVSVLITLVKEADATAMHEHEHEHEHGHQDHTH